MVLNNKPGKKDKKIFYFLKPEMIEIKRTKEQNFTGHVLNNLPWR